MGISKSGAVGITTGDEIGLYRYSYDLIVTFADDLPMDDLTHFAVMRREIRPGEMDETTDGHLGAAIRNGCELTASVAFHRSRVPLYVWAFDGPALPGSASPPFDPTRLVKPWPRVSVSHTWSRTAPGHRYGLGWRWAMT